MKRTEYLTAFRKITICRLLNDIDDTIKLAEEFQATGISAIGVHGRKIHERPQHFNNASMLQNRLKKKYFDVLMQQPIFFYFVNRCD